LGICEPLGRLRRLHSAKNQRDNSPFRKGDVEVTTKEQTE